MRMRFSSITARTASVAIVSGMRDSASLIAASSPLGLPTTASGSRIEAFAVPGTQTSAQAR